MSVTVFLLLFLSALYGVFVLGHEAGQRWRFVGRIFEEPEGSFLVGVVLLALLQILLAAIGVQIK